VIHCVLLVPYPVELAFQLLNLRIGLCLKTSRGCNQVVNVEDNSTSHWCGNSKRYDPLDFYPHIRPIGPGGEDQQAKGIDRNENEGFSIPPEESQRIVPGFGKYAPEIGL